MFKIAVIAILVSLLKEGQTTGCLIFNNIYYSAPHLALAFTNDADKCCTECLAKSECKVWTIMDGLCWLRQGDDFYKMAMTGAVGGERKPVDDGGCNVYSGISLGGPGHDPAITVANKEACCDRCKAKETCYAWTYNNGYCWLRWSFTFWRVNETTASSGAVVRDGMQCPTTMAGYSFTGGQNTATVFAGAISECCQACMVHSECKAFTYIASQQKCWLKLGLDGVTNVPTSGAVAGFVKNTGCLIYNRTLYSAPDLAKIATTDKDKCCDECHARSECKVWTIVDGSCLLKGTDYEKTKVGHPAAVSGYKKPEVIRETASCTRLMGKQFNGPDIKSLSTTVDDCCTQCRDTDNCFAYTYIWATGKCHIKNGKEYTEETNRGAQSGRLG